MSYNNMKTITYEDTKLLNKKVVYGVYQKSTDMTIIFEDIINKETEETSSTEIKGFYYGLPEFEHIEQFYGKLKTEFQLQNQLINHSIGRV